MGTRVPFSQMRKGGEPYGRMNMSSSPQRREGRGQGDVASDHSVPWAGNIEDLTLTKQGKETQSKRPQVLADQFPDPH